MNFMNWPFKNNMSNELTVLLSDISVCKKKKSELVPLSQKRLKLNTNYYEREYNIN